MSNSSHAMPPLTLRTGLDIWRLWNFTSGLTSKNSSQSSVLGVNNGSDHLFFDTYFSDSRFRVETSFAVLAFTCNMCAMFVVRRANSIKRSYSAYNTIFINLALANIIATILSWLTNNIIYLFESEIIQMMANGTSVCAVFIYLLAAVFVSCSFELVSVLNILGGTVVQYYAICRPLYHLVLVRKHPIRLFIAGSWTAALLLALVPFHALVIMASRRECDMWQLSYIIRSTVLGANIAICIVAIMFAIIFVFCIRIYAEIRQLKRRLPRFRFARDIRGDRKAFITTVILLVSLTVFFLPYTVMFMVTLNVEGSDFIHKSPVIYYMNLLPYIKFISDPVVYGMRMREVQAVCLGLPCQRTPHCCKRCSDQNDNVEPPTSPTATVNMHQMSFFDNHDMDRTIVDIGNALE